MLAGKLTEWWLDWIGNSRIQRRGMAELSLPNLLPQAVGLMALAFAGPLFDALGAEVPMSVQQALRWMLLAGLLLLAHFVVVAKTGEAQNGFSYRFSETDRWTSRLAALLALVLTVALNWPQPQGCILQVQVEGGKELGHAFLQLSGDDHSERYPLMDGRSMIEVTPEQSAAWRLELFDTGGQQLFSNDFGGCPDEALEFELVAGRSLRVQPD